MTAMLYLIALVLRQPAAVEEQRTIPFAGMTWNVKSRTGGPGPNHWSSDSESVWVDGQGRLHLKIRRIDGTWHCAEVWTKQSLGYGDYVFQVASNVESYDPNVVAGLFTYLDDDREVDIEFSRWGVPNSPVAQYVVQPGSRPGNKRAFRPGLSGEYSTHSICWCERSVSFESYHGHGGIIPLKERMIQHWTCTSRDIPKAGGEKTHSNLWLNQGKSPTDSKEYELIITDFRFKPWK